MSARRRESFEVELVSTIGRALWFLIKLPFLGIRWIATGGKRGIQPKGLSRTDIEQRWREIQQLVEIGGPSQFKLAIIQADNLVDHVLKGVRVPGQNMGERLKNARNKFSVYQTYDELWKAHKLRNDIVHDAHREVMDFEAKEAIRRFEAALRALGVL